MLTTGWLRRSDPVPPSRRRQPSTLCGPGGVAFPSLELPRLEIACRVCEHVRKSEKVKRILVVEDSAAIRRLLVEALATDYEVLQAADGLTGWLLATADPRPDLIITDIELPKLNGISMVRRLGALQASGAVPVIFLTSRDRPQDVVQGVKNGARLYLTKPFHVEDVRAKVHKVLPP